MKELRVYVIDLGLTEDIAETDEEFMNEAERQGTVYSIKGFENAINSEELNLCNSFIRFIEV